MTYQIPEILRYQGRQYDMEGDPLNAYFLAGGHNPGFHGASRRGYKGTWEILDGRLYLTTLIGDLKDSTQVGLSAVFPNSSERVFADWYTGAIKCPLGIGHEVISGCFDHPAHLIIYVEGGVVHDAKEVPNSKFGEYSKFANDTPQILDESFFVVHEDHMALHYRDERWNHLRKEAPLLDSLSLPVFADFVLRYKKYSLYMREVEPICMSEMSDYEGSPREDRFNFFFEGDRDDAKARLFVTFHSCGSETDYDYIGRTWADLSTAYKHKTGPEQETKFKIHKAQFSRRLGGGQSWFIAEMQRLKILLDRLDAATQTLQSWADSGLSMRVRCSNILGCGRPYDETIDMPAARLSVFAEEGWSIDELKQKLKCRKCGSPVSDLLLAPRTDAHLSVSDRG